MVNVPAVGKLPERELEWRDELDLGWRYENKTAIADKGKSEESSKSTPIDPRLQKSVELEDRADVDMGDNKVNANEAISTLAPYVYNPTDYRKESPMPVKPEDGADAKGQVSESLPLVVVNRDENIEMPGEDEPAVESEKGAT